MSSINLFIFVIPVFLIRYLFVFLSAKDKLSVLDYFPPDMGLEKVGRIFYLIINTFLLFFPIFMYSGNLLWSAITGILLYVTGLILYFISIRDFIKSEGLITKGIYSKSRNPQMISFILIYFGIGITGYSLIYLFLTIILILAFYWLSLSEERYCLEKYGELYKNYIKTTPRFI